MSIIQDTDHVYIIVADCGGGDDHNPHISLQSAMERVAGETGIEIYRMSYRYWQAGLDPLAAGKLVYENW